jgi:hypothetical protein
MIKGPKLRLKAKDTTGVKFKFWTFFDKVPENNRFPVISVNFHTHHWTRSGRFSSNHYQL